MIRVPARYRGLLCEVMVDIPELGTVATSVGPRGILGRRWKCYLCGQLLKPNTAGAQSHLAKHVREKESE
jgi:hypothetical protein